MKTTDTEQIQKQITTPTAVQTPRNNNTQKITQNTTQAKTQEQNTAHEKRKQKPRKFKQE